LPLLGTASRRRNWPDGIDPAGVEEQGVHTLGSPRNLRDLISSARCEFGLRVVPNPKHPATGLVLRTGWSETTQGGERSP
jgi:hypothetical protein